MDTSQIKVLLIEDDEDDHVIFRGMLSEISSSTYDLTWVSTYDEGLSELSRGGHAVCFLDYKLGPRNALEFLRDPAVGACEAPIIILTGRGSQEVAVEARKAGAVDYLTKAQLGPDLLERSIRYAVERRQAEDSLREQERDHRSFLSSLYDDILAVGPDHKVRDVNKDWLSSIGRSRDEVVDHNCCEALCGLREPCDRHGAACELQTVFRSGQPCKSCRLHVRPDGSKVYMDILSSPIKDRSGGTALAIHSIRDITHEIELERQLRHAQKMEAIGRLAGGIAHDFNNILGIIVGNGDLALLEMPEESRVRERLNNVKGAAFRAKELVGQILAFSRGNDQVRRPVHIGPIVKEGLKLLRASLPSTIEIRQSLSASFGDDVVLADATQMHQVLMNLCTNAGYAMNENGGILNVNLEIADPGLDHGKPGTGGSVFAPRPIVDGRDSDGRLSPPGSHIHLSVSDTGPGIDQEIIDKIFDPYFTTKDAGEGTGLGLAMVHGIVESHGGRISVFSEPGKGSEFHVYLPRLEARSETRTEPTREAQERIPRGSETVLFVDDEEELVKLGTILLRKLGYKVVGVRSSTEALEMFSSDPGSFDLVITDQTMPQITGIELARRMMSIRAGLPVVLCTGLVDTISPAMAKEHGFRDFLRKPLLFHDLAETVRRVLDEDGPGLHGFMVGSDGREGSRMAGGDGKDWKHGEETAS